MRILIKGGLIITVDQKRRIIKQGYIGIDDNRIVYVGKEKPKNFSPDITINGKKKAVIPGLVNAHNHLSERLISGLSDSLSLYDWLQSLVWPFGKKLTGELVYISSMLAAIEMIKSGTTCFADMFVSLAEENVLTHVAKASLDVGTRCVLGRGLFESLSPFGPYDLKIADIAINDTKQILEEYKRELSDRILSVKLCPTITFLNSAERLRQVRDLARKLGIGIHIHALETQKEAKLMLEKYGKTTIEYLDDLNFLDSDVMIAHCCWISDREIQILRERGSSVVYNPVSNMKLASGVAPIPDLLRKGVNVALGTDGAASNDDQNMFITMRMGLYLQKVSSLNSRVLTSEDIFEMATIGGAKAVGLENQIGSIEQGKFADLVIVDLKHISMVPTNNIVKRLVLCANGSSVDTVIVNGRIVVSGGKLTTADENEIIEKAEDLSSKVLSELDVKRKLIKRGERFWEEN